MQDEEGNKWPWLISRYIILPGRYEKTHENISSTSGFQVEIRTNRVTSQIKVTCITP
jgi:hypothetical protein